MYGHKRRRQRRRPTPLQALCQSTQTAASIEKLIANDG
jgi:hypothetical protein